MPALIIVLWTTMQCIGVRQVMLRAVHSHEHVQENSSCLQTLRIGTRSRSTFCCRPMPQRQRRRCSLHTTAKLCPAAGTVSSGCT